MARPVLSDDMEHLAGSKLGWDLFLRDTYNEGRIIPSPKCLVVSDCYSRVKECAPFLEARFSKGGAFRYEVAWPTPTEMLRHARSKGLLDFELHHYVNLARRTMVISPGKTQCNSNALFEFKRRAEGQLVECCCKGCSEKVLLDQMFFAAALVRKYAGNSVNLTGGTPDLIWTPPCASCVEKGLLPVELSGSFSGTALPGLSKLCPLENLEPLMAKLLLSMNTMLEHRMLSANPNKLNHLQILSCSSKLADMQFEFGTQRGPLENLCARGTNVLAVPQPINTNIIKLLLCAQRLADNRQPLANCAKLPSIYTGKGDDVAASVFSKTTTMHSLDVKAARGGHYLCTSKAHKTATEIRNVYATHSELFHFECHCCPGPTAPLLLSQFLQSNGSPPCLIPERMKRNPASLRPWLALPGAHCSTIHDFFHAQCASGQTSACVAFAEELSGEDFLLVMHHASRRKITLTFWGTFRAYNSDTDWAYAGMRPFLFFVWHLGTEIQFDFEGYRAAIDSHTDPAVHVILSGREDALQLGQAVYDTKGMAPFNIIWFPWCKTQKDFVDYLVICMANFSASEWPCLLALVFGVKAKASTPSGAVKRIADADGLRVRLKGSADTGGLLFCKKTGKPQKHCGHLAITFANPKGLEMTLAVPKEGLWLCQDLARAFLRQKVLCTRTWRLPEAPGSYLIWGPAHNNDEVGALDAHNATVAAAEAEDARVTLLAYAFYCCLVAKNRTHKIYEPFLGHAFGDDNHPFSTACDTTTTRGLNLVLLAFFSSLQENCCTCGMADFSEPIESWHKRMFSAKPQEMLVTVSETWLCFLQKAAKTAGESKFVVAYAIDRLRARMPVRVSKKRRKKR